MFDDGEYFRQFDGGRANKAIKGINLKSKNEQDTATGLHSYEMHLNISKKLFRIYSSNYKGCQELDDQSHFKEGNEYYFAIYLENQEDFVIVNQILEVPKFPDFMNN